MGDDTALDASGVAARPRARGAASCSAHTFRSRSARRARRRRSSSIPVEIENTGAGHRVPAGFSQEREIWVELTVSDARGAVVYEVGRIDRDDDATCATRSSCASTTRDDNVDFKGQPQGLFGADVVDGPDVPRWNPNPVVRRHDVPRQGPHQLPERLPPLREVHRRHRRDGKCQPGPGQGRTRADRFDDGAYDIDTGECRSNLSGSNAFFETYFPVGALDADRGVAKAPDAILDTRSVPPGVPIRYTYELDDGRPSGPVRRSQARLRFRPFPPFLLRAFADYEARKASAGAPPERRRS